MTALLTKYIKEIISPELEAQSYTYDNQYAFRHIDKKNDTVRLIEFQTGIKSLAGKFTVNLGVYSPRYTTGDQPLKITDITSGFCLIRERIGHLSESAWSKAWSSIFGSPNKLWKDIVYAPRDLWWEYNSDAQVTIKSLTECGTILRTAGLHWLEQNDDPEILKREYENIKANLKKAQQKNRGDGE